MQVRDLQLGNKPKTIEIRCVACQDIGIVNPEGGCLLRGRSWFSVQYWLTKTKSCPFCPAGELERNFRVLWLSQDPFQFKSVHVFPIDFGVAGEVLL